MELETIKFELREDGIGILTLNRPDKLNALNFQMIEDLHSILDGLMVNLDCRVLILKAAGRGFCAGYLGFIKLLFAYHWSMGAPIYLTIPLKLPIIERVSENSIHSIKC